MAFGASLELSLSGNDPLIQELTTAFNAAGLVGLDLSQEARVNVTYCYGLAQSLEVIAGKTIVFMILAKGGDTVTFCARSGDPVVQLDNGRNMNEWDDTPESLQKSEAVRGFLPHFERKLFARQAGL